MRSVKSIFASGFIFSTSLRPTNLFNALHEAIRTHKADLRRLQKEKDALPVVSVRKRRDLSDQTEEKETRIAKPQKRKKAVMQKCGKTDHAGMQEMQKQTAIAKAVSQHVDDRQAVIHDTIARSKTLLP